MRCRLHSGVPHFGDSRAGLDITHATTYNTTPVILKFTHKLPEKYISHAQPKDANRFETGWSQSGFGPESVFIWITFQSRSDMEPLLYLDPTTTEKKQF